MTRGSTSGGLLPLDNVQYSLNSKGITLDARALLEGGNGGLEIDLLETLAGRSIVHPRDLTREMVIELCKAAAVLECSVIETRKPLEGKIVITAFFEASTRTRLSFESAILRLDGRVLSVPDGQVTGIAKGESLADIGEMLNTYGDAVVMRHTDTESVAQLGQSLMIPLINAGNGSGHHPSQALLDWYALLKWRPSFASGEVPENEQVHLGIVGTPGSMRAVKSFLWMSLYFPEAIRKITVVSDMADPFGADLVEPLAMSSIDIETTDDITEVLGDLDLVYMNSIALLGDSYRELASRYRLTSSSGLKDSAVVMHPLARNSELDTSLDDTPHNMYFAQAASAVFARQALLTCVLGRAGRLSELLV